MVVCGFQFFPCSHNHQLFEVNELSYEATDVESWCFVSSNKPVKNGCEVVYEMFHSYHSLYRLEIMVGATCSTTC